MPTHAPSPEVTTSPDLLEQVEREVRAVRDPEIPVISLDDLGVVRDVERVGDGLRVTMTPTYSGCPAMKVMEDDVRAVGARHGVAVEVVTRLSPAWTTDWMSEQGRESLRRFGIAPPTGERAHHSGPVGLRLQVRRVTCPLCGSPQTEEISRFGSTACKALRRCLSCREPFDEFKTL
ncbi:1,2-phenylacetyl-CoA epoxidase subunit PaaD [Ornithinimicrobium avium]|uniref:Phenylacetate-CoA oxygenase subunit PaaJ n=1 Tax=Ornithinimicrobium avium TaxID=2283195 RepID=A0A345NLG1_9MICO|nr:1,2-phenylacetyl-CoA epoxidase subunit PaaD [Ornithinimicrobium avium]AXH95869.1 phenylacetate-CoA oxygenase subunit PaaJ [Ornithinimicrobium avium]